MVALKVLVSITSAPARRYSSWTSLDRLRFRQQQKLDRAFEILAFPIAKTFAAIIRLAQAEALQSCAHRTVEHDDAFLQQRGKRMGCILA